MTEFKGTPGPWTVHAGFLTIYTCSGGETGITIALAKVLRDQLVADYGLDAGADMAKANARAIAAVPEMIAALEQAAVALEEAANVLHEANIGGTVLHGTAGLMSVAAQGTRAALSRALTPEEE